MACDVVVVVPKLDELETIAWAFDVDLGKADRMLDVGGYEYHHAIDDLSICFAFMDGQDTLRAGLVTMEVLTRHQPRYAFLVGTALGNDDDTPVASVVVSSEVQYLVELLHETDTDKVSFRNPTRLTSKGKMSPQARTAATSLFNRAKMSAVIREAGEHLQCAEEAENLLAHSQPDVLVETVGSSNIYYKSPRDQPELIKEVLFGRSNGFKLYDMESAGFARAADALGVDWVVVRGISDHGAKISENVRRIVTAAAGRCLSQIIATACEPLDTHLSGFETRIDGVWRGMFGFVGKNGEITLLEDSVEMHQHRVDRATASVESVLLEGTFSPQAIDYKAEFDLLKLGHLSGRWTDGRSIERYFGVMLAELSNDDTVLRGSWLGVSQATSARQGVFEWHRVSRNGTPTSGAPPHDVRASLTERLRSSS